MEIKNGVDDIKLNLSGGIMGPAWDLHTHSFLLDDEIRAAFEICRKRGPWDEKDLIGNPPLPMFARRRCWMSWGEPA